MSRSRKTWYTEWNTLYSRYQLVRGEDVILLGATEKAAADDEAQSYIESEA